eukprot:TRINITY_DN28720_c0_g2_i1.p1 TRINITY_DN28720_c0_g2~~TRINITY_DN28720_c0_g2_i1.p1  ORF type:complete len:1469 (+),score=255.16 TRINITY_DN28720_c0_g2_i1:52-4407(+)
MTAPASLFDVVRNLSRKNGQALAAIDAIQDTDSGAACGPPSRLTYAQLCEASERLARVLEGPLRTARAARSFSNGLGATVSEPTLAELATWMRRGNSWYCAFGAALCMNTPAVGLSSDLPDKATECTRNAEILTEHRPLLLIVDDSAELASVQSMLDAAGTTVLSFRDLWAKAQEFPAAEILKDGHVAISPDDVTHFEYTGGTTKASRCVVITNRMHLHEVMAYPKLVQLGPTDIIVQQHTMFWAASAIGEMNIALAFGCALLFCKASEAQELSSLIRFHGATCSGLVPAFLSAMQPSDVPSLKVVFTWGEALKSHVARRWAKHVHLVELLISTEYWLSLYADWTHEVPQAGSRPHFRLVDRVQVQLRAVSDAQRVEADASAGASLQQVSADVASRVSGELWLSGDSVCTGYTKQGFTDDVFEIDKSGNRWYCSRDCLEQWPGGGLTFAGRSDDLVKVGGKWLDLGELEDRLSKQPGVSELSISNSQAFVVLAQPLRQGLLEDLRLRLPPGFNLLAVPRLPRHPATGKVDRKRLAGLAVGQGYDASEICLSSSRGQPCKAKESRLCREELLEFCYCYLAVLAVPCFMLLQRPCFMLLHRLCFMLLHQLLPQLLYSSPDGDMPHRNLWGDFLLFVCDLMCRLLCMSYLLFWRLCDIDRWNRWLKYAPMASFGACMLVPAVCPSSAVIVTCALLSASRMGWRALAWPLVCLVGFPSWVREASWWLRWECRRSNLRWRAGQFWCAAWQLLSQPIFTGIRRKLLERAAPLLQKVGWSGRCAWCKRVQWKSCGRVDVAVDKSWYCNDCWKKFYSHRLCSRCEKWTARYVETDGGIICDSCGPELQPQSSRGTKRRHGPSTRTLSRVERTLGVASAVGLNGSTAPSINGHSAEVVEPPAARRRLSGPVSSAEEAVSKCKVWRIVEHVTGVQLDSRSTILPHLDSLRSAKLQSALRRKTGRQVSRETIRRSSSLGDLISAVENTPRDLDMTADTSSDSRREYSWWGMMLHSKCEWYIHRERPLSEHVFRRAVEQLVDQHEALRTELVDPLPLFRAIQQSLTTLELFRRHGRDLLRAGRGPVMSSFCRRLDQMISWGFRNAWPKVRARAPGSGGKIDVHVLPCFSTIDAAWDELWTKGRGFVPPFRAVLAPFGQGAGEGAAIYLAVSHMFADGYSVVPLLQDLAQIVANLEAEEVNGPCPAFMTPPLNTLARLQARLFRTIDLCGTDEDGPDRGLITRDVVRAAKVNQSQGNSTELCDFHPQLVAAIRAGAHCLAVPDDVALLAAVAVALAWFNGCRTQYITTIVPQRDGHSEQDMVGLLADFRQLAVHTAGLHFAGAAMGLYRVVRERLWKEPGLATQNDLPMVNCMWTDFSAPHGFAQSVLPSRRGQNSRHPVLVSIEQSGPDAWHLAVTFRTSMYSSADQDRFFFLLEEALLRLCQQPLELLWPCPEAVANAPSGG